MALISLPMAKAHLRITTTTQDADVQQKVDAASAVLVDYLKTAEAKTWDDTTAPLPVQMATLVLVAYLWQHRGDDPADRDDLDVDKGVWAEIDPILIRFRTPALA
jgi:lysophospholipid acyltransferase (LPLAT)-like uncharacterized protein